MDTAEKVREARLRRVAGRRGYRLVRKRRRDHGAIDYGTYHLVPTELRGGGEPVGPLTLDEIEKRLVG
jgi:hypothetical protein